MEILNSIWRVFTTENEMMANLLIIPCGFIEVTVIMLLFTKILNINYTKKQGFCYIFIFSIIVNSLLFLVPKPLNTSLNVLSCIILIKLIFKVNIFKAILADIIPNIIFVIISIIVHNIFIAVFNLPTTLLATIPIYKIGFSLTTYLIVYIIYLLMKRFDISISILDDFKIKDNLILIINFAIGIVVIAIQSCISFLYSDKVPFIVILINLSTLVIYFVITLYSLSRTNKLELTQQDLEQSKEYNKTLEILHDNVRCFKHDFNNIITTIGGYVQSEDLNGLKKYYSNLQTDCEKINNLNILNPSTINEPAIYSLLTNKYHQAESKGIKVNLEVFIDLKSLRMKVYEFTRILGILLDNAIEAANECDEKIINIAIRKDFHSDRQLLIIENTYKDKDIDTEKIYDKGYSTKEHNTGIGLWEVRQILKKNNNLNLFTSKNEKFFSQQLEIY